MELLTDELEGFKTSIDRLEKLLGDTDFKFKADTSQIEMLLRSHCESSRDKESRQEIEIKAMKNQISKARLISKVQLWLHYTLWAISMLIIGYLIFQVNRIDKIKENEFELGVEEAHSKFREVFERHPEYLEVYRLWLSEKDSTANME